MTLAQFISENVDRISLEWEKFAATRLPAASTMTAAERRDHVRAILQRITEDIATPETAREQSEKAKGNADAGGADRTAAQSHGAGRAESGFTADQMVSEFRALRASVIGLWLEQLDRCDRTAFDEMTRFHEAIDQALAESVRSFTRNVDHAKELFLGVLGHDLRTPLGAIMMGATVLLTQEQPDWAHARTAQRILSSGERMDEIIRDLLDFTRGRLGSGIPVDRADMNLDELLRGSIDELAAAHPGCRIVLVSPGSVHGEWDRARLEQVIANLIGNACQHGAQGEPVEVTLTADHEAAVVEIHNQGPMIEPRDLNAIFEPFRAT